MALLTRARARRRLAWLLLGAVALWLVLQVVAAWAAAHPEAAEQGSPLDDEPGWDVVDVATGIDAWYRVAGRRRAAMVLVHGYGSGPAPLSEVAVRFHDLGYSVLVIALPYADGSEPFSGGRREAAAVQAAVHWLRERVDVPVALVGFSAGGFASALAVAGGADVEALVLDSAFVDAAATFVDAAADVVHVPGWVLAGLPHVYPLVSGGGRLLDLDEAIEPATWDTPTFVIHGADDDLVPLADAVVLARATDGRLRVLDDRGHVDADYPKLSAYVGWIDEFVRQTLSSGDGPAT